MDATTLKSTTLRPGLLVSVRTRIEGNISYAKTTIIPETIENNQARAQWETTKTIADAEEYKKAETARNAASAKIRGLCANSAFGLLCPEADGPALAQAIREARAIADQFNETAGLTRVTVHVITGRIAPDDVEAVKAINSEMAELMDTMTKGVRAFDVKAIRDAASKAKALGAMLPANVSARAQAAIDAARKAARAINKAGEQAAMQVDNRALRAITEARTAFLDLEDTGVEIQAPVVAGRTLDLEPTATESAPIAAAAPSFDF